VHPLNLLSTKIDLLNRSSHVFYEWTLYRYTVRERNAPSLCVTGREIQVDYITAAPSTPAVTPLLSDAWVKAWWYYYQQCKLWKAQCVIVLRFVLFHLFFIHLLQIGSSYYKAYHTAVRISSLWISYLPIRVAARSKAWVYGSSLAGIVGSNPAGDMDVCVECCQVEVSVTGWSLVQRSPTECDASFVWSRNLKNEEAMARVGPKRHRGKNDILPPFFK